MVSVVNVRKKCLQENGFADFEDWAKNPNHLYIGRQMDFYVRGAVASKWQNPFRVEKYGLEKCLALYEEYIRTSELYQQLDELEGKVLGCWCLPKPCHGDVLIRLLREKNSASQRRFLTS